MENYQAGIDIGKYTSKENLKNSGLNYNLGEYRQKYLHTSAAENMYNNFIRFIPRGNHIGNYESPK